MIKITLKECLKHMSETVSNPELQIAFNQSWTDYIKRVIEIKSNPNKYRSEIGDALNFLSENSIGALSRENMIEELENL